MADAVEAPAPPPHPELGGESGRSSPSPAASPEFEFWMVGKNPSPDLPTADELFSGGVVLPLHNLQGSPPDGDGEEGGGVKDPDSAALPLPEVEAEEEGEVAQPLAESSPVLTPDLPAVTFKWKDIFKAGGGGEAKDRKAKLERRISSVGGNAELININIWPFSRSRSAGHSAGAGALGRAKPNPNPNATATTTANSNANANAAGASSAPAAPAPAGRKVSSAPCSRSNSRGESAGPAPAVSVAAAAAAAADATANAQTAPLPATSMLRRLVPGQGRNSNSNTGLGAAGIRLGRANPVWQLRRNKLQQTAAEQKQASAKKKAVPAAAAATSDDKAPPTVAAPAAGCRNNAECPEGGEEGNPPQGLFGLRTFFSKKVY
ncbi:hypothetical protein ACP70R_036179 [Stipagrostis hirtigluma subsp. patula]